MTRELRRWGWALLDPVLLKMRARLEHLAERHPVCRRHDQAVVDPTASILPEARLENVDAPECLRIGAWTTVRGQVAVVARGGRVEIGHHCYVGEGSRIWAQQHVKIGNHVLVAHHVDIHDTNAHSFDYRHRRRDTVNLFEHKCPIDWAPVPAKAVTIEDDVWIGLKSTVLKGVTIGRGAIVAAGSLVRHDVPPFTLVAGSPARVVGMPGGLAQGDE